MTHLPNPGRPTPETLAEIEQAAIRWAREAGDLLLTRFRTALAVEYKSKNRTDPVTEADREAERHLHARIHERFPDHGVLGEEGADAAGSEFLWVLDPLDGTTNFINGLPLWCVSVGVLWRNRPVVGAIFTPAGPTAAPCVFHARADGGAFMDDMSLLVANEQEPTKARLSGLPGHYWQEMRFRTRKGPKLGETRTLGSIALEMGLIAAGVLQYGVFWSPKIWDVAAGALIIREARGEVRCRIDKMHKWSRLTEFNAPSPDSASLRAWKGAIIAGSPRVVRLIAEDVQTRQRLLGPLTPLWTRYRDGGATGSL